MTPTGASRIIRSRNSVWVRLACGSPNARNLVAISSSSLDISLPLSTRAAARPTEAPRSRAGAIRCRNILAGPGSQGTRPSGLLSPDAVVAISTAPTILDPNSPGCPPASAMIVMPPMEWPASMTRVFPGATACSTACRSSPVWFTLTGGPAAARPERPCPRWSEHQPRRRGQVAALIVPAVLVQRVSVAEHDRDRRVVRAIDLDVQRHPVRCEDDELTPAQLAKRLTGRWVGGQPEPVRREPFGSHHGANPGRGGPHGDPGNPGDPPPVGHLFSRPVLLCLLFFRPWHCHGQGHYPNAM